MQSKSNFEIHGRLTRVGPIETRVSMKGKEYQVREIEIETTDSQYENIIPLQMIGKSAGYAEGFQPGDWVTISCDLRGSTSGGRRWVNVTAYHIKGQADTPTSPSKDQPPILKQ